jgi:tape measure domain-containing protein
MATTETVTIIIESRGAARAASGIKRVGRTSRTAAKAVRLFTVALAAVGAGAGIGALLRTADTATRLDNKLRVVTKSTEEFTAVQARLRDIANETRAPIEATTGLFQRFRVATRDLGTSQADVLKVVKGLNAAIVVSGVTAQEGSNALIQLAQGLASARLGGDELRSVLENLPPLAQALSDELGVTVGQLREMGQAGELNAKTVFPALLAISDKFNEKLKELPVTLDQAQTILSNAFINTIGDINKTIGSTETLGKTIVELSKSLRDTLIDAFIAMSGAVENVLRSLAKLNEGFSLINVKVLPGFSQTVKAVFVPVVNTFQAFEISVLGAATAMAKFGEISIRAARKVGQATDKDVADATRAFGLLRQMTLEADADFGKFGADLFKDIAAGDGTTAESAKRLDALADSAGAVTAALEKLKAGEVKPFDLTKKGEDVTVVPGAADAAQKRLDDQERALGKIAALTDSLRIKQFKAIEPLDAQLEKLRQQEVKLIELGVAANNLARTQEGLALIDAGRERIEQTRIQETVRLTELHAEITRLVGEAALVAPALSAEIRAAADAAVEAGGGLEKVNQELAGVVKKGTRDLNKAKEQVDGFADFFADRLQRRLGNAISKAIKGEGFDAAELFADFAGDLVKKSLEGSLEGFGTQLKSLLSGKGFEKGEDGSFGFGGGGLFAGLTAGATAALAVLPGALRDTQAVVQNSLVDSAADTAQAAEQRGVIAGPSSIPIFQVGQSLEAAFSGTESKLDISNDFLSQILEAIQATGVLGAGVAPGVGGSENAADTLAEAGALLT